MWQTETGNTVSTVLTIGVAGCVIKKILEKIFNQRFFSNIRCRDIYPQVNWNIERSHIIIKIFFIDLGYYKLDLANEMASK